jgi:hypothetical protein
MMRRVSALNLKGKDLAEREGFEPPIRFPVHLISRKILISVTSNDLQQLAVKTALSYFVVC